MQALFVMGTLPFNAHSQMSKPRRLIGWLSTSSPFATSPFFEAFAARLRELGFVEGRDVVILKMFSSGRNDVLPILAKQMIALNPDVIVTGGSGAIAALKNETKTVPIVFGTAGDVVAQGLVMSFGRPGGN